MLVVDGADQVLKRKTEISLVPGRVRARSLSKLVSLSREIYNATVQHRRDAWRLAQVTVTRFDEFNEIPDLRTLRPDVAAFGNQFRGSTSRADEAFAAFFRRLGKVDPRNSSRECAWCGHTEAANRERSRFSCRRCGHGEHADVNAAQVIAARGRQADALWVASGSPRLTRPTPRNRRRNGAVTEQYGAGSAPHAQVA